MTQERKALSSYIQYPYILQLSLCSSPYFQAHHSEQGWPPILLQWHHRDFCQAVTLGLTGMLCLPLLAHPGATTVWVLTLSLLPLSKLLLLDFLLSLLTLISESPFPQLKNSSKSKLFTRFSRAPLLCYNRALTWSYISIISGQAAPFLTQHLLQGLQKVHVILAPHYHFQAANPPPLYKIPCSFETCFILLHEPIFLYLQIFWWSPHPLAVKLLAQPSPHYKPFHYGCYQYLHRQ